jgi:hypothetical protein
MARAKLPPGIQEWTPHPETGRPRYLVRWRAPERKSRMQVFDRLVDARDHLAEVTAAKRHGVYIDASLGRQTFDDFAQEWAAAQDNWKEGTVDAWPSIRARLRPHIGAAPLASIDQLALKKLRAKLAERYAPATVTLTMAYAGMVLRAAYASRRIGHDPTVGLRAKRARAGQRTGQVGPHDVPTRAEALAILACTPASFRAAVALGLAGLRIGEVLGMTADRLELRPAAGDDRPADAGLRRPARAHYAEGREGAHHHGARPRGGRAPSPPPRPPGRRHPVPRAAGRRDAAP